MADTIHGHDELMAQIEELRNFISRFNTETFVKFIENDWLIKNNNFIRTGNSQAYEDLMSPERQILYLYGMIMSTSEPSPAYMFDDRAWRLVCASLNAIFLYYSHPDELSNTIKNFNDFEKQLVASQEFLYSFNVGSRMTVDNLLQYLQQYYVPFDNELKNLIGISASSTLSIIQDIESKLRSDIDGLMQIRRELPEGTTMTDLLQDNPKNNIELSEKLRSLMERQFMFNIDDLHTKYGEETCKKFCEQFVSTRGKVKSITYINDLNLFQYAPFIQHEESWLLCPLINWAYQAAIITFEKLLSTSTALPNYPRRRSEIMENQVLGLFSSLEDKSASIYHKLYETHDLHNEHDIIIKVGRTLIAVESKAGKKQEPFWNPDKAFDRIAREFKSDTGIQKAYDQSMSLYHKWKAGETITLYDKQDHEVLNILPSEIDQIYGVCITREDIGAVAVSVPRLLTRKNDSPFPLVMSVFDLERYISTWNYFHWDWARFIDFIDQRLKLYDICFSSDEIEYLGFYIHHGSLNFLFRNGLVYVDQDYSSIVDLIYYRDYTGKEITFSPKTPDAPQSIYENGIVMYFYRC